MSKSPTQPLIFLIPLLDDDGGGKLGDAKRVYMFFCNLVYTFIRTANSGKIQKSQMTVFMRLKTIFLVCVMIRNPNHCRSMGFFKLLTLPKMDMDHIDVFSS